MAEPRQNAPRARSRRWFWWLGSAVLAIVLAVGVYLWVTADRVSTDDAQVEADVTPIGARVPGQVLKTLVRDNQTVREAEVLVELDPADYRARMEQADAMLSTAQAQAKAADAQVALANATATGGYSAARAQVAGSADEVATARAGINQAEAGVDSARARARESGLAYARTRKLFEDRAIAEAELDRARATHDVAQAAVEQAESQLKASRETLRAAESRVAQAQGRFRQSQPVEAQVDVARANAELGHARVKAAEAELTLSRLELSYTRIAAPAAGTVSRLNVHPGQILQAGQPVAEFVPIQTYVVANFKETDAGRIRPGQRAKIAVDAYPGRSFPGRVESLSAGTGARFALLPPDNATGNFVKVVQRVPVRIAWNPPSNLGLQAGLSVKATI